MNVGSLGSWFHDMPTYPLDVQLTGVRIVSEYALGSNKSESTLRVLHEVEGSYMGRIGNHPPTGNNHGDCNSKAESQI